MPLFSQPEYEARNELSLTAEQVSRWDAVYGAVEQKVAAYLRRRVAWPMETVPADVIDAALKLMRYELHPRKTQRPSHVLEDRANALQYLELVAKGLVLLENAVTANQSPSGVAVEASDPIFDVDNWERMPPWR